MFRIPLALSVALGVYLAHTLLYIRHVSDDAFITFRYSRFLASGLGPYFNLGEHVEGYTNLLHMLLMAIVYAIAGEHAVPLAAKAVGIGCGVAAMALVYAICRLALRDSASLAPHGAWVGGLAAGLVAVFPGFAVNSTSGLETLLLAMLVTLGVYLGMLGRRAGRWKGSGFAWAAAALARPEAPLIFAAYWISSAVAARPGGVRRKAGERTAIRAGEHGPETAPLRNLVLDALVVLLVVAAQFVFRFLAYDGELLPNTYHAKAEGHWERSPWEYVRQGALSPFFGPLGLAAALVGWWRAGTEARAGWPLVGVSLLGGSLPFIVGTDWMPGWRFSVPYLPLLAGTVALGWLHLAQPLIVRNRLLGPALALLAVVALAAWHHGERRDLAELIDLRADGYASGHEMLAGWIRDAVGRPGDTVALMDIGLVGYYCAEQRILDITGLTDRHIAKSPGRLLRKQYDPKYVLDQEPEIIVIVLSAYGDPSVPLVEPGRFGTWIGIEGQLLVHPEFRAHYVRTSPSPSPAPGASWLERLAAEFGAERVFEHAHPGQYYLLAAFRRQAG